ncbi:unnamed protein product [Trichogramma brassicae]|uniref:Uncharacterized protein n=1 Tax=Trichogramma brassicae TaxID=86971 RepID=A0A6H5ISH1_9HYME|nr:unnamed protein product [Trichogramma brassicae]
MSDIWTSSSSRLAIANNRTRIVANSCKGAQRVYPIDNIDPNRAYRPIFPPSPRVLRYNNALRACDARRHTGRAGVGARERQVRLRNPLAAAVGPITRPYVYERAPRNNINIRDAYYKTRGPTIRVYILYEAYDNGCSCARPLNHLTKCEHRSLVHYTLHRRRRRRDESRKLLQ